MNQDKRSLEMRIVALFGTVAPDGNAVTDGNSPFDTTNELAAFEIPLALTAPSDDVSEEPDACEAAAQWLDTPNATFGGACPRTFLQGTEEERTFLAGIVASIEDGAFS